MGKKMKDPPVYFTIGQVQHNPLLNLAAYVPTIQESMRKSGYPDFRHGVQVQFEVSASLTGKGPETAEPVPHRTERYSFLDVAGTRCLIVQTNSVSFETTEYETFDHFLMQLKNGLQILSDAVGGLSYMERIGIRYLDAVVPKTNEKLSEYLVAEVMGLPARMPNDNFAYSFAETVLLAKDIGQVVSRTVIQNGPLGFPPDLRPEGLMVAERFRAISGEHAIIDTDGSFTERKPFDLLDIENRLISLHDLIDKTFRATVTDYALATWDTLGAIR
jgi:uncharacterized protein (TIGR04255 family)